LICRKDQPQAVAGSTPAIALRLLLNYWGAKTMYSLDKAIRHYKAIAKAGNGNQAHYALGALEVLKRVKNLRETIRAEMRSQYRERGGIGGGVYWYNREFVRELDNLMLPESEGR
jgi:hypothetical protein